MYQRIIISYNLGTEIKTMLTGSKLGIQSTFRTHMVSLITYCAGSVQMTNEPLQYVHLNPIPGW
jgi:hypothetical protein